MHRLPLIHPLGLVFLLVSLQGCGLTGGKKSASERSATAASDQNLVPINVIQGTVVNLRQDLRYVVADFGLGPYPKPGQLLSVLRGTEPVGTVRVSNMARETLFTADIVEGRVLEGDLLRGF